nr:hypothetical protein CFP56_00957 [Quercus suber]
MRPSRSRRYITLRIGQYMGIQKLAMMPGAMRAALLAELRHLDIDMHNHDPDDDGVVRDDDASSSIIPQFGSSTSRTYITD